MFRAPVLPCMLAVLVTVPGAAAQTLTESQTIKEHSWVVVRTNLEAAQTFEIALGSAGLISQVEVWLSAVKDVSSSEDGVLHVELQGVSGGLPDGSVDWSIAYDILADLVGASVAPGLLTIPVSPPLSVSAGEKLALVLRVTGGLHFHTEVICAGSDTDAYASGVAVSRTVGEPSWTSYVPDYDIDRHFMIYKQ